MRTIILSTLFLVGGCASSVASLGEKAPARTFDSTRPAEEVASCISASLNGSNPLLRMSPDHFVVSRNNGYGIPIVRWDVFSTPTGSHIELRASFGLMEGEPKARECAGLPREAS